ncbi:MAG: PD-(D/E)XK nuclease family protein [Dehalococcoidia bacterium]|nr:PD-(D/E)XK nuclease family protein [Dehalococcoidia bacterium]
MLDLSPFRLNMFRQCRRKYKFHYLDGLQRQYGKPQPHFTMGNHVHWSLNIFLRSTTPARKRTMEHLESLLRDRWVLDRSGFADRGQERDYWQKALRQLRGFFATQDVFAVPKMTEATHKAALTPDLRLMGKIDRVDQAEDGLVVIDYKTGRRPMAVDLLQLRTYALILQKRFGQPVVSARYLFLESGGVAEIRPEESDLGEAEEELIACGREIRGEQEFLAAPNRLCSYCDFLEICPEGIAYGGPRANPDEDEFPV